MSRHGREGSLRLRSTRIVCPEGVVSGEVVVEGGTIAGVTVFDRSADARGPAAAPGPSLDASGSPVAAASGSPVAAASGSPVAAASGSPVAGASGSPAAPPAPSAAPASAGELVDLGDHWLIPGMIDLHVHGGGGAQFNTADPAEVLEVARFHARHGTTALLATTVAAPVDELVQALEAIRGAMEASSAQVDGPIGGPAGGAARGSFGGSAGGTARGSFGGSAGGTASGAQILGAHLEGPFLSPARPGAMDPAAFTLPDEVVWRRLLLAGGRCVRLMTLAPELPESLRLIAELVEAGVVVSLGHSEATYAQACAAASAGARSVTHLFNAMVPFHHRAPGLIGAALALPELDCELICDGIHASPAAGRIALAAKGFERMHLVTDAMAAAGMPDGEYRLGATPVRLTAGRVTLADSEVLAGSALTMDVAFGNAARLLGLDAVAAAQLCCRGPARLLGLEGQKGAITIGADADLAILDEDFKACGTLVGGRWVHPPVAA